MEILKSRTRTVKFIVYKYLHAFVFDCSFIFVKQTPVPCDQSTLRKDVYIVTCLCGLTIFPCISF